MARQLRLHTDGVEYLKWKLYVTAPDAAPIGPVSVSIDDGESWHPAQLVANEVRWLVAHPDAENPDPAAVVLPRGSVEFLLMLADTPEVVVRPGGSIWVG